MPHVSSVKVKNFLSYGNNWTEFNFEEGVTRIIGQNGNGKSTCPLEAIWYGFTGKPYRDINLPQLVNAINKKELEVHINFSINNTFYRIERGIKPNLFRIYMKEGEAPGNGEEELIPLNSATRSYQQMFEEDHLKFPATKILDQVAIKSLTRNMSFLSLKAAEKRELVENMLDIKVFTEMNKLAKTKVDALEREIQDLKKSLDHTQLLINQEESNIDRLRRIQAQQREDISTQVERMKREIEEIEAESARAEAQIPKYLTQIETRNAESAKKQLGIEKIQKYKTKKADLKTAIDAVQVEIREFEAKIKSAKAEIPPIEDQIRDYKSKISLSENKTKFLTKTCGGCQKIDQIAHADNVEGLKKQVADAEAEIEKIYETIEGFKASIDLLGVDIKSYNTQIAKCDEYVNMERGFIADIEANKRLNASDEANITQLQSRIKRNAERIEEKQNTIFEEKKQEIVIDVSKWEGYKAKYADLEEDFNKKSRLKKHYVYARKLLGDDAIKSFVVNKYLPSINTILNSYLQKFGSEITMNFDAEFNEVFTTRFKENYSYYSLSEGQKKRVDLSILFMWRKFCQTKFQQADLNFLMLDEVSSGLDVETQDKLQALLKQMAKEENKCIITISHDHTIDPEKIDHLYEVTVDSGFSKLIKKVV